MVIALVPAAAPADPASAAAVEAFIHEGLPFFASRVPAKKLRSLAELKRETVTQEQNKFDESQTDAVHLFEYTGMRVWLLCAPAKSDNCMLIEVTLSRPKQKAKYGLTVGATAKFLETTLGAPGSIEGAQWVYRGESSEVLFTLKNGLVKEIQWNLYTG